MSQKAMILKHLEEYGSITDMDATDLYGCRRLAARIADLRAMGHNISTELESGKNRFDKRVQYARYRLER